LADADEIDHLKLQTLIEDGIAGTELVPLAALACHRAGGSTWEAFRVGSKDQLNHPGLSGEVVVLISRLPGSRLLK
jgi:hypothetical protein